MIRADSLVKSFRRRHVLRGVSFEAQPGEVTLLVGPNGAGKTTTLKILAGLVRPDAGRAVVGGRNIIQDRTATQAQLSFLPQAPGFHPRFTCRQIVDFYGRLRGIDRQRRAAALELAGLSESADQSTGRLSGGMRQRLGLALLFLPDASVLLLDEPGLSLDPAWRWRLQSLLHHEAHRGKTILVTTHLLAEWNNVAHRCLLCRDGVIERELDPADLAGDFDSAAHDGVGPATNLSKTRGSAADDAGPAVPV